MRVVIIGASSGIGKEVANVFSKKGHKVICGSRDGKELARLVSDLKIRYGNTAYDAPVDITKTSSIKEFIEKIKEHFSTIDCVVVTSGTISPNNVPYYDEKSLINTTKTNYLGIVLVLNEISHRMAIQKSGLIICLSSVAGERGRQGNFIYGASKSALNTYLQGLRMKMHKYNVRVVTVLPGYVDTLMSYGKVKKQFAISPRTAAEQIYHLTGGSKNIVYIPAVWRLIMFIIKLIPESIFKRIGSNF